MSDPDTLPTSTASTDGASGGALGDASLADLVRGYSTVTVPPGDRIGSEDYPTDFNPGETQ